MAEIIDFDISRPIVEPNLKAVNELERYIYHSELAPEVKSMIRVQKNDFLTGRVQLIGSGELRIFHEEIGVTFDRTMAYYLEDYLDDTLPKTFEQPITVASLPVNGRMMMEKPARYLLYMLDREGDTVAERETLQRAISSFHRLEYSADLWPARDYLGRITIAGTHGLGRKHPHAPRFLVEAGEALMDIATVINQEPDKFKISPTTELEKLKIEIETRVTNPKVAKIS